ncbi:MAG: peptide chain release factor N(5)-glutamine methyltransferase [Candidatus Binatia bacterium]
MNLSGILMQGVQRLHRAGIDSARLDAELLLGWALGMSREDLIVAAARNLSLAESDRYEDLLKRRLNREPLAYITGQQEFWSLDLIVSSDVLVPRPETELLVEIALKELANLADTKLPRILELGTGSGAISVALATESPQAQIVATEISPAALAIARRNACRHGVSKGIRFLQGDLFTALDQEHENDFDLVVSNPPYIPREEISNLEAEVSRWEPRAALDGGVDGLNFYRLIAQEAPDYLRQGGVVAVEIGATMSSSVLALFKDSAAYLDTQLHQDYSGRDRVIVARTGFGPELV